MSTWNPALYSLYEDERTRPARDLLAHVPLTAPRLIYDLGCGPGNSTELLIKRFESAKVVGIDNSEDMLVTARKRLPQVTFQLGDIASWMPSNAPDLIFANAVFHWVHDHETLLPRLLKTLAPGGSLALQMPDNHNEPTHKLMREIGALPPYAQQIGDMRASRAKLLNVTSYYDLLVSQAETVDIWRTIYHHPMASPQAIVDWVSSTGLRPFLDRLDPQLKKRYLAEYKEAIAQAYFVRADGKRLLYFPRLFIVATMRSKQ
jgi:trans-aconitate 2-methyltransferase